MIGAEYIFSPNELSAQTLKPSRIISNAVMFPPVKEGTLGK